MAVVDNAAGVTIDATGQHMGGKLLDGLPAAVSAGQSTRFEQSILTNGVNPFAADQSMGAHKLTNLAAATVSTDAASLASSLDQFAPPAADLNLNSKKLTSVANPVSAQDAETKAYGDTRLQTLGAWGFLSSPAVTANRFPDFNNVRDVAQPAEVSSFCVMPFAGTIVSLYVFHGGTALTTDSITYTVRVNSVDSSITSTVAANGVAANDTAHTVNFNAGDRISIRVNQSSTQAQANLGAVAQVGIKTAAVG